MKCKRSSTRLPNNMQNKYLNKVKLKNMKNLFDNKIPGIKEALGVET